MRVLDEPHRIERGTDVDDLVGRGDPGAHTIAHFIQKLGDLPIPRLEQAERREQRGPVRRDFRKPVVQRGDRMRLVEAEDLLRCIGAITKAVPDLALLVALAAEQHVAIAVGIGDERDHRFGFGKAGQIIEIAVVPERIERIAIARDFGGRRHERYAAAAALSHRLQDGVAPLAVNVMGVVHRERPPGAGRSVMPHYRCWARGCARRRLA